MPHPMVEIHELTRLVIDKLVETSPRAAVPFAHLPALEEPTISSLSKRFHSELTNLMKVLPNYT